MVSTFIFGINKCMQKDRKKGTEFERGPVVIFKCGSRKEKYLGRVAI
jgi:hypothetical protein